MGLRQRLVTKHNTFSTSVRLNSPFYFSNATKHARQRKKATISDPRCFHFASLLLSGAINNQFESLFKVRQNPKRSHEERKKICKLMKCETSGANQESIRRTRFNWDVNFLIENFVAELKIADVFFLTWDDLWKYFEVWEVNNCRHASSMLKNYPEIWV